MSAPIVLLTDFGTRDGYVGVMKGVIAAIHPAANVIDLSHDLPAQDISAARFVLWNAYRYFPPGSIFVCVIDPGVGSGRPILSVQTDRHVFIAPDNGLLDYVLAEAPTKLRLRVENKAIFRQDVSQTFHGRDIFAPVAAHLSAGFPITQLGPVQPFQLPDRPFVLPEDLPQSPLRILHVDHFGNLITNLELPASVQLRVRAGQQPVPFVGAYASVPEGAPLAIRGSHGLLELSVRNGNARTFFGWREGQDFPLEVYPA